MYDTVFFLVKATLKTSYRTVEEAINEVQEKAKCTISDTGKVKICEVELMKYKLKTKGNGTQS